MGLPEDLVRLDDLRVRGVLSDDEFLRAKTRLLDGSEAAVAPNAAVTGLNRLRRSRDDRWFAGVCGGLARSTGVESWALRLVVALLALLGGTGVLLYALLWIFVPEET